MQIEQYILPLVISITTAIITAWVTVFLSLRRFRAEKLWIRRVDAYQRILEALHTWSRDYKAEWERQVSQSDYEPTESEIRKSSKARAEIYKAIDLGSFLLSDEAAACMDQLVKGLGEARSFHKDSYIGYLADTQGDVDDCLKNLRDIAKKDIKKLKI